MRLKRLVNFTEQRILEDLRATGKENNFQVEANQRIADVIEISKGEIPNNEFYFALSSHFDFTICQDYETQFVIEFDGPHHDEPNQKQKDDIKDRICQTVGLPILRLDSNIIRNKAREYSIAQWFAEIWFLSKEFDKMQEAGQIPPSEPFMYQNILGKSGGPMNFPYDIARPVLLFMHQLHRDGVSKGYSARSITYELNDKIYCKTYFRVSEDHVVSSRTEFKSFRFYPISPFELALDLAIINLEPKIVEYFNSFKGGMRFDEALKEIQRMEDMCNARGIYHRVEGAEL